jgi:flavin-dependent dehydrogenase
MGNSKIIIIGGGPAGSTAASFLAMRGHDVTLFEKDEFPRPHVGESLLPFNYDLFEDLGVLDKMTASYNRKPGVKFSNSDGMSSTVWYFDDIIDGPGALSFHVERASFDKMLLDRARELGVKVFENSPVRDVEFDQPHNKVKVSVQNADGDKAEFDCDFIIDASGQYTFLAKKLQDKNKYEGLDRVAINSHWINPAYDKELDEGCVEIIHLGGEKKGWIWAIPLHKKRLSVGVVVSKEYYKAKRADQKPEEIYLNELKESPLINDVLKSAKKEAHTNVHGDYSYYSKNKYGDNYAIIGDASAFLDPIFSSGIYVSMMSAKMVTEHLDLALKAGNKPGEALLKVYSDINGGYQLLEKLIRIFYDPNAIALSSLGSLRDEDYQKFQTAYRIYHYILQGDFFDNYSKYMKDIDILRDVNRLDQYSNLVKSMNKKKVAATE